MEVAQIREGHISLHGSPVHYGLATSLHVVYVKKKKKKQDLNKTQYKSMIYPLTVYMYLIDSYRLNV